MGQVFTVDFDGDIQNQYCRRARKTRCRPSRRSWKVSLAGRPTISTFPAPRNPAPGCVSWAAGPAILMDGTRAGPARARCVRIYRETSPSPSSRSPPARRTGSSRTSVDPETPSDDVDYLRTIKAGASQKPPEVRSAWGIVDRASTVAHAELTEEEAQIIASDWPTRAPFVLRGPARHRVSRRAGET